MPLSETRNVVGAVASHNLSGAATTFSVPVDVTGAIDWVAFNVNLTAIAGTAPNLTLSVEWSDDGGTTWYDGDPADSFTALTAVSKVSKRFLKKGNMARLKEAFTGTAPTATYAADVVFR